MALPTSSAKPAQLSIRSFFQPGGPKYAPPPSSSSQTTKKGSELSNGTEPAPQAASRPAELSGVAPPPPPPGPAPSAQQQPPSGPVAFSIPPLPATLPREASIRLVTSHDIPALKRINALLLSVSYPDWFYNGAADLTAAGRFSRVITWQHNGEEPKVVGGIVCRLEPALGTVSAVNAQVPRALYIQSLCLLSPYRSLGLAGAAVDNVVATAVSDSSLGVRSITAHVWTENDEGLQWYQRRGFYRDGLAIPGYYLKLRPDSAYLVRRDAGSFVRNSLPTTSTPTSNPLSPSITAAVVNLPAASGPPTDAESLRPTPSRAVSGQSFQNQRPETEWNDLPAEMAPGVRPSLRKGDSEPGSAASSRSSSKARKKRDRSYPAAAFGS